MLNNANIDLHHPLLFITISLILFVLPALGELTGEGVDEEDLADVERESHPATDEKHNGECVRIFTGRIEHGPHTVDSIQSTEVEVQSKLDPTTARRVHSTPVGKSRQLAKDSNKTLNH